MHHARIVLDRAIGAPTESCNAGRRRARPAGFNNLFSNFVTRLIAGVLSFLLSQVHGEAQIESSAWPALLVRPRGPCSTGLSCA
eukprot:2271488-Pyramimonas_sp.AAC.1